MSLELLRKKREQPQNESGYIVILSIGSILGAGLFCGSTVIYDLVGVHLAMLIVLAGILALFVNFFLIEMNLVGPTDWNYTQIMADIYGPAAGHLAVAAYIGAMVVGPASEIIAAGIMLCSVFDSLPLSPVCLALSILVFIINHYFKNQKVFSYYVAVFKILALLAFCCIGLFAICHLFKGTFYSYEVPWPIRLENIPKGSINAVLGSIYGTVMIYGGIESVGFLFYSQMKERGSGIAVETFKVVFRIIFVNILSILIVMLIMPGDKNQGANIFIRTLEAIGCNQMVIDGYRIIIFSSALFLAITSTLPTTQLLRMQAHNDFCIRKAFHKINGDWENKIDWFINGLILLGVSLTQLFGENAYVYTFFFSGFCFCIIWSMIAMACSKFCDKHGDGSEWRVPGEHILRYVVLIIMAVCFAASLTTELGRIVVLMAIGWFSIFFLLSAKFNRNK